GGPPTHGTAHGDAAKSNITRGEATGHIAHDHSDESHFSCSQTTEGYVARSQATEGYVTRSQTTEGYVARSQTTEGYVARSQATEGHSEIGRPSCHRSQGGITRYRSARYHAKRQKNRHRVALARSADARRQQCCH